MATSPNTQAGQPARVSPEKSDKVAKEARELSKAGWGDDLSKPDPEAIILFGPTRVGKSRGYLSMVEYAVKKALGEGKEGDELPKAYVINLDRSGRRDLENFPLLVALDVVKQCHCDTVDKVMVATCALIGDKKNNIPKIIRPGDWLIVDRATVVWEGFPDYWARTRLDKSCDDIEYEYQTKSVPGKIKKGSAMLEFYSTGINPLWFRWEYAIRTCGAHCVFVCTDKELVKESTAVREKDAPELISIFGDIGVVPKMQSDTWSRWHTQLYLSRPFSDKKFFVRTVGDRGSRKWLGVGKRTQIGEDEHNNLGALYLGEVAGWGKNNEDEG